MSQSPIRLKSADALPLAKPTGLFECFYRPSDSVPGCFEGEPGHGNFVVQGAGPIVNFRGNEFDLRLIHLHRGSEHVVEHDDKEDLELHFVHAPKGSAVASPLVVIGVLFRVLSGSTKKTVSAGKAFSQFVESAKSGMCINLKPLDLFPRLRDGKPDKVNWFHYEGSLTTFPYSEIVSWVVMKEPAIIDPKLINELLHCSEQEQRELQPLSRRIVVRSF